MDKNLHTHVTPSIPLIFYIFVVKKIGIALEGYTVYIIVLLKMYLLASVAS